MCTPTAWSGMPRSDSRFAPVPGSVPMSAELTNPAGSGPRHRHHRARLRRPPVCRVASSPSSRRDRCPGRDTSPVAQLPGRLLACSFPVHARTDTDPYPHCRRLLCPQIRAAAPPRVTREPEPRSALPTAESSIRSGKGGVFTDDHPNGRRFRPVVVLLLSHLRTF